MSNNIAPSCWIAHAQLTKHSLIETLKFSFRPYALFSKLIEINHVTKLSSHWIRHACEVRSKVGKNGLIETRMIFLFWRTLVVLLLLLLLMLWLLMFCLISITVVVLSNRISIPFVIWLWDSSLIRYRCLLFVPQVHFSRRMRFICYLRSTLYDFRSVAWQAITKMCAIFVAVVIYCDVSTD